MTANKSASQSLDDTGERMIPEYHKSNMIYGEHIVRYEAVADLVRDKTVLDIASGSGYGTALIAKTAKHVTGIDVSEEAIAYAKEKFSAKNVNYISADGVNIPLADKSVDVVVSFETIEHIEHYKTFLSEVKRILKPDGLFILSTPNDLEFAEGNHFHVHEFEQDELETILQEYFKYYETYFQASWLYNALTEKTFLTSEGRALVNTINVAPIDTSKVIYFFVICSNRKISEKIKPLGAISQHWSARRFQEEYEATQQCIKELHEAIARLEKNLLKNEKQALLNRDQAMIYLSELNAIRNSKSWKYARKVARIKGVLLKTNKPINQ